MIEYLENGKLRCKKDKTEMLLDELIDNGLSIGEEFEFGDVAAIHLYNSQTDRKYSLTDPERIDWYNGAEIILVPER